MAAAVSRRWLRLGPIYPLRHDELWLTTLRAGTLTGIDSVLQHWPIAVVIILLLHTMQHVVRTVKNST